MAEIFNPQYNSNPKQVDVNKEKIEELEDAVDILAEGMEELDENKQDKLIAGQNITLTETPEGVQIDATDIDTNVDVQIDGTSIVNNKVANIKTINNNYNKSTNKIATQYDLQADCVQKVGSDNILYGRDNRGEHVFNLDTDMEDLRIAQIPIRSFGGNLAVPLSPLYNYSAASKKYVDDAVAGAGGGITELNLDTIDFSTFFTTHEEGLYLLSTSDNTTELEIIGTNPNNTFFIDSNPNQKMLLSVAKNYSLFTTGAPNITWNGITIFQGGGLSNVYQIREQVQNTNLFITDNLFNLIAAVNGVKETALEPIYDLIDLATFYNMYLQYASPKTIYKPICFGSDFVIYGDETDPSSAVFTIPSSEIASAIILASGVNTGSSYMAFSIYTSKGMYYINCSIDGSVINKSYYVDYNQYEQYTYKHNITFSFDITDTTAPTPNTYSVAGCCTIIGSLFTQPITTASEFISFLFSRGGILQTSGGILDSSTGVPISMLGIGCEYDNSDPITYPDGLEILYLSKLEYIGTPLSQATFDYISLEYDRTNDSILDHMSNFTCDDHMEQY